MLEIIISMENETGKVCFFLFVFIWNIIHMETILHKENQYLHEADNIYG